MKENKKSKKLKVSEIEKITKNEGYPLILEQISVLLYLNRETATNGKFIKMKNPYYNKFALDLVGYGLAEKQIDSFVDKILIDPDLDGSSYSYRISSKGIWLSKTIKEVYDSSYRKFRVLPFIKERGTNIIAFVSLIVSILVAILK